MGRFTALGASKGVSRFESGGLSQGGRDSAPKREPNMQSPAEHPTKGLGQASEKQQQYT